MSTELDAENPFSIYAELLPNIRQVSIIVSLPSPANLSTTSAEVSSGGSRIEVRHDGLVKEALLPGPVSAPPFLPIPTGGPNANGLPSTTATLSWRLPVSSAAPASSARDELQPAVPWGALDLVPRSAVRCRACRQDLVSEGKLDIWKDLPSENWAEMMDFWHCHKPHDHKHGHGHGHGHHGHGHARSEGDGGGGGDDDDDPKPHDDAHLAKRGYGANSNIAAQRGVGFVDLTSFLFAEEDCTGLKFSLGTPETGHETSAEALKTVEGNVSFPRLLQVYCSNCGVHSGFFNVSIASVALFKWQVDCQTSAPCSAPTSPDCLAATLLATLSRSGSSKSVVVPSAVASQAQNQPKNAGEICSPLHVWVLNGNIEYSSSVRPGPARSALKILWQSVTHEEADKMLDSFTSGVQEVSLPAEALQTLTETLGASTLFLPAGDRVFKNWQVGLLDRWTG